MTILEALESTGEEHTSEVLRLLAEYLPIESRLVVTREMIGAALRGDRGDLQTLCAPELAEDMDGSGELTLDFIEDDGTRISIDDYEASRLDYKNNTCKSSLRRRVRARFETCLMMTNSAYALRFSLLRREIYQMPT